MGWNNFKFIKMKPIEISPNFIFKKKRVRIIFGRPTLLHLGMFTQVYEIQHFSLKLSSPGYKSILLDVQNELFNAVAKIH